MLSKINELIADAPLPPLISYSDGFDGTYSCFCLLLSKKSSFKSFVSKQILNEVNMFLGKDLD